VTSVLHVPTRRPFGIQLLAALLTLYTMAGVFLAVRIGVDHDPRSRWWLIAATLAVWRLERHAPAALLVCGALGGALCLALPAAVPADALPPGMWRVAIQGALLVAAFLALAAWYVRNVLRTRA
jgi:hypothetical protein